MISRKVIIVFTVLIASLLYSCDGYNKLLKSQDYEKKYEAAVKYFEEDEDYFKALQLFDELLVVYRGTVKAQKVYYYYAYCYYYMEDYILGAYHFQKFAITFPNSDKAEECFFMSAYCKYLDSPKYSLDQTSTMEAIQQLQSFANIYPASDSLPRCNELIDELRYKLEVKSFEAAKSYYTTEYYKSAIYALNRFLKEHPVSKFKEESLFLLLDASFIYADKSIEGKRKERFDEATEVYNKLIGSYPQTKYLKRAEQLKNKIDKELEKYTSNGL
jgi:outer membrane protein assembly factor BamD